MLNVKDTIMDCGSNDISSITPATSTDFVGDKKPYNVATSCPNAVANSNFKLY